MLRLGPSIGFRGTLINTLKSLTTKCCQFELIGSQAYTCQSLSLDDKLQATEYCFNNDISFYVHLNCSYDFARGDYLATKTFNSVQRDLDNIAYLPASGILHIGRTLHGGSIEVVGQRVNSLNLSYPRCNSNVPYPLLLENAAGQGTELGVSVDEIRKLFEIIDHGSRVGLCIDTQHSFASGICNFGLPESINKLFDEDLPKYPSLIHLNDSKKIFGSRVDRHENIGVGYIFNSKESLQGLKHLFSICKEKRIDIVLETPHPMQLTHDLNLCYSL